MSKSTKGLQWSKKKGLQWLGYHPQTPKTSSPDPEPFQTLSSRGDEKGLRILYRFSTNLGKKAYGFFTDFLRMYRKKAYGFFTDFVRILRILFSLWQKKYGIFYGFREKGLRILYRFSTDLGNKAYGFFTEFLRMYRKKAYGFFTDFVRILRILFIQFEATEVRNWGRRHPLYGFFADLGGKAYGFFTDLGKKPSGFFTDLGRKAYGFFTDSLRI